MTEVPSISDSAILLVIQDNAAHKISFSKLRTAMLNDVLQQISAIKIDVSKLTANLEKINNNKVDAELPKISSSISKLDAKILEIEKDIDKKKIQKLADISDKNKVISQQNSIQLRDLSSCIVDNAKKLNSLSSFYADSTLNSAETIESLSASIKEQNIAFSKKLTDISAAVSKNAKTLANVQKKSNALIEHVQNENSRLSSRIDDLDVKLFGLTVADVDLDTAEVTKDKVKDGAIDILSAQISCINSQLKQTKQM